MEEYKKAIELIKKYNIRPSDFNYFTSYYIYLVNSQYAPVELIMTRDEYEYLKKLLT